MAKDHDKEDPKGGHGRHAGGHADEEHSGAPEWLISFADNVVLLMGFFVILLAMNMKEPTHGGIGGKEKHGGHPTSRELDLIIGIREAFNRPIDLTSDEPTEAHLRRRIIEKRTAGQSLQPQDPGEGREHQTIIPTERSALGGLIPFDDDADTLSPHGRQVAERVGDNLAGHRWIVEVRGHASPFEAAHDPERASQLGYRRALAVARILADRGVTWAQMRIASSGDNDRKVGREYERDAVRANQRVEVIVTGDPAP